MSGGDPKLEAILASNKLLTALVAEVRGLRADVQALGKRTEALKPGPLLIAIAEAAGNRMFTTRELVHHADYRAPLHEVIGGKSPKALGRLFRRIENQDFDGLCIKSIGPSRDGVLWRVCEFGGNTPTL
jgi:hypothetical protein